MICDTCHLFFRLAKAMVTQHLTMHNMDHALDDMDFTGQWTIALECGVPLLIINYGDAITSQITVESISKSLYKKMLLYFL